MRTLFIALLFLSFQRTSMGAPLTREDIRYWALAQVQSGENDLAVGIVGERSRFQIRPLEWKQCTTLPLSAATNPFTAMNVCKSLMQPRVAHFVRVHKRVPSNREWLLLYHCPARLHHPIASDRDLAQRFANLVNLKR